MLLKQVNFRDEDMLFLLRHIEGQGSQKQLAALSDFGMTPDGIRTKIELTEKFIERKKKEYEELQFELEKDKVSLSVIGT